MFTTAYCWSLKQVTLSSTIQPSHNVTFMTRYFTLRSCFTPFNPFAGGPHLISYPQLLIQYIHSCPPRMQVTYSPTATRRCAIPWRRRNAERPELTHAATYLLLRVFNSWVQLQHAANTNHNTGHILNTVQHFHLQICNHVCNLSTYASPRSEQSAFLYTITKLVNYCPSLFNISDGSSLCL